MEQIIQITSDPYKKNIRYERMVDGEFVQIDINDTDTPPNSKLLSTDFTTCFFPFKAYEIIIAIWEAYSDPNETLTIRFKGTSDEYDEFIAVCKIVNEEIEEHNKKEELNQDDSIQNSTYPLIKWEKANEQLKNARDILPNVKGHYETIKLLLAKTIKNKVNNSEIKDKQDKWDDVSKTDIPICVIGNYSSGKSTFINALIGYELLPTSDDPMTAKIFEIRRSKTESRAQIDFTADSIAYQIRITEEGDDINPKTTNSELVKKITLCLKEKEKHPLSERAQAVIELINESDVNHYVRLIVPFCPLSPFGNSLYPFVIFDTPGSDVADQTEHIKVLEAALQGMSNGLMIYVTSNDDLRKKANKDLCDKVKSIQQIDRRFTLVIINRADEGNIKSLNMHDKNKVKTSMIPELLQPEGIYYVSSLCALGAKLRGVFVDSEGLGYTYNEEKKKRYDGTGNMKQNLAEYDIAPKQIEKDNKRYSDNYAERGDLEKILANCGFYLVELELLRFAEKYSAYNKCYQSLLYLQEVEPIAQKDIGFQYSILNQAKEHFEELFDKTRTTLTSEMYIRNDGIVEQAINEYHDSMKSKLEEAYTPLSTSELEHMEEMFTKAQEEASNYIAHEKDAESAWKKFWHGHNPLSSEGRAALKKDFELARIKSNERDKARNEIDDFAAQRLIEQVKQIFMDKITQAQNLLFVASTEYWTQKADLLRNTLLQIVMNNTSDLSDAESMELQGILNEFEQIGFTGEVDQIFLEEIFKRHAFTIGTLVLFEDHKLNKTKIKWKYNSAMKDGISDIYTRMRMSHRKDYLEWQKKLLQAIEEKMPHLNVELQSANVQIETNKENISELHDKQQQLEEQITEIRKLMEWQPILDESES